MKHYKTLIILIVIGLALSVGMVLYSRKKGSSYEVFDDRTESVLNTLLPELQMKIRRILSKARKLGYDLRAISGERTCTEQNKLYAKGRTASGSIVTNAQCGMSYHNYRMAVDLAFYKDGSYWQTAPFNLIGEWGKEEGLEWGGDWTSLVDPPHLQLPDKDISALNKKYQETGELVTV